MKRTLAILLCILFLLCGCENVSSEETVGSIPTVVPSENRDPTVTTEPPVTEPLETDPIITEPPEPETEDASVLVDGTVLLLEKLPMGTTVEILGSYDDNYYIVKLHQSDGFAGLIEKRLVRMDDEEKYTPWTGYSYYGAGFYTNYLLLPEGVQELGSNKTVEVLDSLEDVLLVRLGETIGYMRQESLSRKKIISSPSGGNSDGGDIELGYHGSVTNLGHFFGSTNPENAQVTGTGTVKAEDAEVICGWYDRGDTVSVVTEEPELPEMDGWCVVYAGGIWGYVRQNLILRADAEPYTSWDGYAKYNAPVYDNYYLYGEVQKKLPTNTVVQVLEDLGCSYLVRVGDIIGYMAKDKVSETQNAQGGNSGGQWSDPVM